MALGGSTGGGGGGSAGGIRAGAAFVELYTKDNALRRGLDAAQKRLAKFAALTAGIGARIAGAGTAVLAPLAALSFDKLGDLSKVGAAGDAFGMTAEQASRLFGVMRSAGSDTKDATEALVTLNQRIADAAAGRGEEAVQLFQDLGRSAAEFSGLDTADRFYAMVEAIKAVQDPAKRVQLLLKTFGEDSGKNLIPVLSMTSDQLREAGEQFAQTGADVATARKATLSFNAAFAVLDAALTKVAVAAAPALVQLAEGFTAVVRVVGPVIDRNKELVAGLALGAAAAVGVGAALVGVAGVAAGLGAVLAAVGTAFAVVGKAVALLLSPVGLVTAALAAGTYAFLRYTEAGKAVVASLSGLFNDLWGVAQFTFGGVADALKAGNLGLAADTALAGVKAAWTKFELWLTERWVAFKGSFVDGWHQAVAEVAKAAGQVAFRVAGTFARAVGQMFAALAGAAEKAGLGGRARQLRAAARAAGEEGRDLRAVAKRLPGQIDANLAADQLAREDARAEQLRNAEGKALAAFDDLAKKVQAAAIAAGFASIRAAGGGGAGGGPPLDKLAEAGARGAFAGALDSRGFFAGGAQKVVDAVKLQLEEQRETNRILRAGRGLVIT